MISTCVAGLASRGAFHRAFPRRRRGSRRRESGPRRRLVSPRAFRGREWEGAVDRSRRVVEWAAGARRVVVAAAVVVTVDGVILLTACFCCHGGSAAGRLLPCRTHVESPQSGSC